VAIKFSHRSAIEREYDILIKLKKVTRVAQLYGCCYLSIFAGITLQLFSNNLAFCRMMNLVEVALMGRSIVRVEPVPLRRFKPRHPQGFYTANVHRIGIIHNDIKPENIVTSDMKNFYLIDWKAAKYKADCSEKNRFGTPQYMSVRRLKGARKSAHPHDPSAISSNFSLVGHQPALSKMTLNPFCT
jgi:serine/threonine protein kinase